jgi:hypothetical protein
MNQSVVKFLENQIGSKICDANIRISAVKFFDLINEAYNIHYSEITNAWNEGQKDGCTICTQQFYNPAQQYYKETFKNQIK